jgi:hypothetical protein
LVKDRIVDFRKAQGIDFEKFEQSGSTGRCRNYIEIALYSSLMTLEREQIHSKAETAGQSARFCIHWSKITIITWQSGII